MTQIIFPLFRWHRAVSTNLVKQNVLAPKEESSSDSDMEFHKSQQNQKKNLVKKVKMFWGGCCHTRTEASQQVSTKRVPLTTRKPSFQIHRAFFLELSRSFHHPSYLPNQEWESSPRMVIQVNIWSSVKAKRENEIGELLLLPTESISGELVWNAEVKTPPRATESESAF